MTLFTGDEMGRPKSEWLTEAVVKKLAAKGMTDREIAATTGANLQAVKTMRNRHGIACNPQPRRHAIDDKQVAKLNAKGWNDVRIGDRFGVSRQAVRSARQRGGIPAVPRQNRLRDFTVGRLRELVRRKLTDRQIGELLGRTFESVRHFRLRNGITKRDYSPTYGTRGSKANKRLAKTMGKKPAKGKRRTK